MTGKSKFIIKILVQATVLVAVLYIFISPISVRGVSMQSTLYDGDKIMVSRFMGKLGMYESGDIVVFRDNVQGETRSIVKRIIAMENDEVYISGGRVYVNGMPVPEAYINGYTEGNLDIIVPKGCIFVMGDNRESSFDSRQYGSVSKTKVSAKVVAKVYPLNDIRFY